MSVGCTVKGDVYVEGEGRSMIFYLRVKKRNA